MDGGTIVDIDSNGSYIRHATALRNQNAIDAVKCQPIQGPEYVIIRDEEGQPLFLEEAERLMEQACARSPNSTTCGDR